MENVFLYNIDDLQAIAADYLNQRKEEVAHCEHIFKPRQSPAGTPWSWTRRSRPRNALEESEVPARELEPIGAAIQSRKLNFELE
jgi:glutamyl-tRNA reductase